MSYNRMKMQKLLEIDRFLHDTFQEVRSKLGSDDKALEMLFETYVMREPIMQNAYLHLT
jgi:predicted transcriptional regulator